MPIKQSITYTVKCDREDCGADIDRDGYEPVFNNPQQAIDEATEYECDADDQRVLCPEHARPFCPHCNSFVDQASKDDDGEDCCADCLPHHTAPVAV